MIMSSPVFLPEHRGLSPIAKTASPNLTREFNTVFPITEKDFPVICLESDCNQSRQPDTLHQNSTSITTSQKHDVSMLSTCHGSKSATHSPCSSTSALSLNPTVSPPSVVQLLARPPYQPTEILPRHFTSTAHRKS